GTGLRERTSGNGVRSAAVELGRLADLGGRRGRDGAVGQRDGAVGFLVARGFGRGNDGVAAVGRLRGGGTLGGRGDRNLGLGDAAFGARGCDGLDDRRFRGGALDHLVTGVHGVVRRRLGFLDDGGREGRDHEKRDDERGGDLHGGWASSLVVGMRKTAADDRYAGVGLPSLIKHRHTILERYDRASLRNRFRERLTPSLHLL
ncbi:hypothetical protein BDK51DRAFT_51711, partial [Blyttiomyces helicus]